LELFQQQYCFSLNVVDIDADSYLKLRYGERVPVLAAGDMDICYYHLNKDFQAKVSAAETFVRISRSLLKWQTKAGVVNCVSGKSFRCGNFCLSG